MGLYGAFSVFLELVKNRRFLGAENGVLRA